MAAQLRSLKNSVQGKKADIKRKSSRARCGLFCWEAPWPGWGMLQGSALWHGGTAGHCHRVTSLCFPSQETWEPGSSRCQEGGGDCSPSLGSAVLLLLLSRLGVVPPLKVVLHSCSISFDIHFFKIAGEWLEKVFLTY